MEETLINILSLFIFILIIVILINMINNIEKFEEENCGGKCETYLDCAENMKCISKRCCVKN